MLILSLSDLHGHLPDPAKLAKAAGKGKGKIELILLGGDYAPRGAVSSHPILDIQTNWFKQEFSPWLDQMAKIFKVPIIGIAGNHDFVAEYPWGDRLLRSFNWTYLRDQDVIINGLKIFGSPWSPRHPHYPRWAFQTNEESIARHWAKIPADTDILLVHGPPLGAGDKVGRDLFAGSKSLAEYITRRGIGLVVCGHIHEQPGQMNLDTSVIINTSITTPAASLRHQGWVIEVGGNVRAIKSESSIRAKYLIDAKTSFERLMAERMN